MRESQYLVDKCQALAQVICFFRGEQGNWRASGREKRYVFLSQVDFWEWEIDVLIYSCNSFLKRCQSWKSGTNTFKSMFDTLGIPVKNSELRQATFFRACDEDEVVAPVDKVNEVIDAWNDLLALCERTLMKSKRQIIVERGQYGVVMMEDLGKYRKERLEAK